MVLFWSPAKISHLPFPLNCLVLQFPVDPLTSCVCRSFHWQPFIGTAPVLWRYHDAIATLLTRIWLSQLQRDSGIWCLSSCLLYGFFSDVRADALGAADACSDTKYCFLCSCLYILKSAYFRYLEDVPQCLSYKRRPASLKQTCTFQDNLVSQLIYNLKLLNAFQLWNNSFFSFLWKITLGKQIWVCIAWWTFEKRN